MSKDTGKGRFGRLKDAFRMSPKSTDKKKHPQGGAYNREDGEGFNLGNPSCNLGSRSK